MVLTLVKLEELIVVDFFLFSGSQLTQSKGKKRKRKRSVTPLGENVSSHKKALSGPLGSRWEGMGNWGGTKTGNQVVRLSQLINNSMKQSSQSRESLLETIIMFQ